MRFAIEKWQEVAADTPFECKNGFLHIMSSKFAAVFVSVDGSETLVGTGTEIKVSIAVPCAVRVETEGRPFVYGWDKPVYYVEGECFTNLDRMPLESGSQYEVLKELRRFKLQQRDMLREMRAVAASQSTVEPSPKEEEKPSDGDEREADGKAEVDPEEVASTES